jgi:hypothetical protein
MVVEELPATVLTKRKGVGVGLQNGRELEVPLNAVIGIPDKDIVRLVISVLERLRSVMPEVLPFIVIDLP